VKNCCRSVAEWLSACSAVLLAAFTFVLVLVTAFLALFAAMTLWELRRSTQATSDMFKLQRRPWVLPSLPQRGPQLVPNGGVRANVVVENYGQGGASNCQLRVDYDTSLDSRYVGHQFGGVAPDDATFGILAPKSKLDTPQPTAPKPNPLPRQLGMGCTLAIHLSCAYTGQETNERYFIEVVKRVVIDNFVGERSWATKQLAERSYVGYVDAAGKVWESGGSARGTPRANDD